MKPVRLLLDKARLTDGQIQQFDAVRKLIKKRTEAYIVDQQLASKITADTSPTINDIIQRHIKLRPETKPNRKLLDVERTRYDAKIKSIAEKEEWRFKASEMFHRELYKTLELQLVEKTEKAIGLNSIELLDVLYHPNIDYRKLAGIVEQDPSLIDGILSYHANEKDNNKVPASQKSMKAILGHLGVSVLDNVIPLILAQNAVNVTGNLRRSSIENKLKRLMSYNVLTFGTLLEHMPRNNPYQRLGGLMGVLEPLSYAVVYRLFCLHQESVKDRVMKKWYQQSNHTLYNALQDIDVNFDVLPIWFDQLQLKVKETLINYLKWNHTTPARRALEESHENIDLHERSQSGILYNHAYHFAQFKFLLEGKMLSKNLITPYFYGNYISNELSRSMLSSIQTSTMELV